MCAVGGFFISIPVFLSGENRAVLSPRIISRRIIRQLPENYPEINLYMYDIYMYMLA